MKTMPPRREFNLEDVFKHICGVRKIYQLKENNKLSELWVFRGSNDCQISS